MTLATPRPNCNPAPRLLSAIASRRRGVTLLESVVLILLVSAVILIVVAALPRQREAARVANCRSNLMRIGVALGVYHQGGSLPMVVSPLPATSQTEAISAADSPLGSLLMALGLPDLQAITGDAEKDARVLASTSRPRMVADGRIAGFLCPSDDRIRLNAFKAPVSYRAATGDRVDGGDGVFAPGRPRTYEEVQNADGAGYTAAFSERLIGDGVDSALGAAAYHQGPGAITADQCPDDSTATAKGDAGWSWSETSWRSSLYNHAAPPNASSSCIAPDERTARLGASSAHVNQVQVLMLDGRVQTVAPTINAKIWRMMATVSDHEKDRPSPP